MRPRHVDARAPGNARITGRSYIRVMTDELDPRVPDAGPWRARLDAQGALLLESDDFNHDVLARVSGDFATPESRLAYGQFLADVLTRGCRLARAQHFQQDEGALLRRLDAARGEHGPLLALLAEELARLRVELDDAGRALQSLGAHRYFTDRAQDAAQPSALALALQQALAKR